MHLQRLLLKVLTHTQFSILPEDISKCNRVDPGIKPLNFQSVDVPLYLLSHSSRHVMVYYTSKYQTKESIELITALDESQGISERFILTGKTNVNMCVRSTQLSCLDIL